MGPTEDFVFEEGLDNVQDLISYCGLDVSNPANQFNNKTSVQVDTVSY